MYDLPAIRPSDLETLLLAGIQSIADTHKHGPVDVHAFLNIFHRCIKPLFETVRDVRRYLSILPLALDDCGAEVALSDVLALEAMRLHAPESHALLPAASHALTTVESGMGGAHLSSNKADFEHFVNASPEKADIVRAMSSELFPASRRFIDNTHYGGDFLSTWRKARRVAHRDVLQFYLTRSLPVGVLPASVVELAFGTLDNETHFRVIVESLTPDELPSLLGRLEDFEHDYPEDGVQPACIVLMQQHHRLERRRKSMFAIDPNMQLCRVVVRLLRRIDDELRRTEIIEAVLDNIESLSARCSLIDWVGHRQNVGAKLVPEDVAKAWMTNLVSAVLSAGHERLSMERDLLILLDACVDEADTNRPSVATIIESDEVLMATLRSGLRSAHQWNMGDVVTTQSSTIPWEGIERLFGKTLLIRRITELLRNISGDTSDAETRAALEIACRQPQTWGQLKAGWPQSRGQGVAKN